MTTTSWHYDWETGGGGGISPVSEEEVVRHITERGYLLLESSLSSRPINHRMVGAGVGHDDALFAETGGKAGSMATYYENGGSPFGRWWEDTDRAFSHGVKYYGCEPLWSAA